MLAFGGAFVMIPPDVTETRQGLLFSRLDDRLDTSSMAALSLPAPPPGEYAGIFFFFSIYHFVFSLDKQQYPHATNNDAYVGYHDYYHAHCYAHYYAHYHLGLRRPRRPLANARRHAVTSCSMNETTRNPHLPQLHLRSLQARDALTSRLP